jgi:hypothetical protein
LVAKFSGGNRPTLGLHPENDDEHVLHVNCPPARGQRPDGRTNTTAWPEVGTRAIVAC